MEDYHNSKVVNKIVFTYMINFNQSLGILHTLVKHPHPHAPHILIPYEMNVAPSYLGQTNKLNEVKSTMGLESPSNSISPT